MQSSPRYLYISPGYHIIQLELVQVLVGIQTNPPNKTKRNPFHAVQNARSPIIQNSSSNFIPHSHVIPNLEESPAAGRPDTAAPISAVHPAGASGLLARTPGEGALELKEGAADLVPNGGVALLVVDGSRVVMADRDGNWGGVGAAGATAGEETAAARSDRGGHGAAARVEERHVDSFVLVVVCGGGWLVWF